MRQNLKRVGKRSLAIILAVMMIFSIMLVGMVSTNASMTGLSEIYFTPDSNWSDESATFKLKINTSSGFSKIDFQLVDSTVPVYKATLNSSTTYYDLQFLRFDSSGSTQWDSSNTFSWVPSLGNGNSNYYVKTGNDWSAWDATDTSKGYWTTYGSAGSGNYYVAGNKENFGANWTANDDANKLTSTGSSVYSITYTNLPKDDYQFKITSGSWDNPWGYDNNNVPVGVGVQLGNTGGNISFRLSQSSNVTIEFNSSNNKITVTVTQATTTYKVTYGAQSATYGSVSAKRNDTNANVSSDDTVPNGTSVTFTATTKNNGVFGGWYSDTTCSNQLADSSSLTYTTTVNNNTNVFAKFTELINGDTYAVAVSPVQNGDAYISSYVDANGITQTNALTTLKSVNAMENRAVQVKVVPNSGYQCTGITVKKADGSNVTTSGSGNSYTFTMPASDVTVSATFEEKPKVSYSVYFNGGETAMAESASQAGVYISEEKISGKNFWFKIKKVSESTTTYSNAGNGNSAKYFSSADSTYTIGNWDTDNATNKNAFSQNTKTSYYIVYNSNTGVLSLSSTSDARVSVKVYAKHGTRTFVDKAYKGTYNYGTTVATAANSDSTVTLLNSSVDGYKLYTVSEGSSVKVTTTINATYSSKYYVHAFVVNGISYDATADVGASYYAEFPVEAGVTNYEVTPIYYLNACKTEGEYIKFYVDASELTTDHGWGNTISSYSYCYTGSGTKAVEPDGSYPGQPMLFDKGQNRYYCLVPKSMDDHSITGVTVNNYKNDEVHSLVNSNLTTNEQSYDYDDFKYAYELGNDIIRFDMKPRSAEWDNISYVNGISNKTYTFSYNTFNVRNGWEAFKDNDGNNVDVLGFPVDPSNTNKLYVVSTADHDVSGVGQWATKWYVYAADGDDGATLITYGLPSDFIPRSNPENNTAPYKAVLDYADGAYKNAYTEITFENRKTFDSANRLDGRWYYAQNDDEVTADVKYRTSEDGTTWSQLKEDASVAFINNATTTSITFEKHGETARLVAAPIVGYVFSGWGVVDKNGENYRDLDSNLGASFETVIDAEMHFVANYVKAADGNIVLSHSKYIADDAKGANGYYKISARVQKEDGSWTDAVSGTGTGAAGQTITLNDVSANDKLIEVTLTTVTAGENTFRYWYTQSTNGFEIIEDLDAEMTYNGSPSTDLFGKSGTFTYTFYTDVSKLFANNKQIISQFNYYSDIDAVTKDYVLTYNYDDRFGNPKSYVVKGTHNDEYYEANGNSWKVNQQLIYDNAPAIDDLYKDCIWKLVDETITYSGSSATIKAIQNEKTHEGTITIEDDGIEIPFTSVKHNTFLYADTEKETFYSAEGNNFLYWIVYEMGTKNEVAKCYTKDFALRIVDDYDIVAIFGEAEKEDSLTIGEATYTREQYTDSTGNVKSDYVYADFLVSFMSDEYIKLNSEAADSYPKYHTGIIVEMSQNSVLPEELTFDDSGKVIYNNITFDSDANFIMTSATSGKSGLNTYTYNTDKRKVYNFIIDNTKYNNYNRLDYYVKFNNTESNQKYVMKAYYYVYQTDENGSIIEGSYQITDCVYFNLYDIGKSDATIDMETT